MLDGTLRCLERLPAERLTARVIAEEAGANLASIVYHFGSKDALVTAAIIEGLDRWLDEVELALAKTTSGSPSQPVRRASAVIELTRRRHSDLVRSFVAALAKAPYEPLVREQLAKGFGRTRPAIARVLGLGADSAGVDAGGLALAMFYGLMIQTELDPGLAVSGKRFDIALARLCQPNDES